MNYHYPTFDCCADDAAAITAAAVLRLMKADQVRTGNTIRYYQAGSNQMILLHTQVQEGDPCTGDVSLITQ